MGRFFSKVVLVVCLFVFGGISAYAMTGNPVFVLNFTTSLWRDGGGGHGGSEKKLDLLVGSQCHYYNYDPQSPGAIANGDLAGYVDVGCADKGLPFGTWKESDLNCRNKFFNFSDIKPGDRGEDTISLKVSNDDGCGQMIFKSIKDSGNVCNEPEVQANDPDCRNKTPGSREMKGELGAAMKFSLWLDQGRTPGFQGKNDQGEGDNVFNENDVLLSDWKSINKFSNVNEIRKHLRQARNAFFDVCKKADADGDGKKTKNNVCAGLSSDGRMIKDVVYYYGLAWRLPPETGNEVQTDGLGFDLSFSVKSNASCSACSGDSRECERRCGD